MTVAGLVGGLKDLAGGLLGSGSVARQMLVWNVLGNVVSAATGPFTAQLQGDVNAKNPVVPLTPAELADMVVRGVVGADWAPGQAARSGLSGENFSLMVTNSGEPPALQEMLSLLRRGKIDQPTMEHAIRQSRIRDEWIPFVLEMGLDEPTPIDILQAYLQGQVDHDTAVDLYVKLGGDIDYFQLLYDTRGSAPTPTEAALMARRGIIPWDGTGPDAVSYAQAFLEGPWRNKWADAFRSVANYAPPPRTVSALYAEHALTQEQALKLFGEAGLSPDLAAAMLAGASKTKTATHRNLAVSTIEALYQQRAIPVDEATSLLEALGYDSGEAQFILLVSDMKRYEHYVTTAIGAVHSQYVGHKIDAATTSNLMDQLGVASTERDHLMALWLLERGARVHVLTPADIRKAANNTVITPDDATARLITLGYSAADAAIYLAL
jgi:hypothetical protein